MSSMLQKIIMRSGKIIICAAFLICSNAFAKPPAGMMGMGGKRPPTPVEATKVQYIKLNQQITITGSIRATQGITVRPEIDGRITGIYFKAGDEVVAGTKLIQLNPEIVQAKLTQSKAELKLAEQDYARYSSLFATHAIAKSDLDKAAATLYSKQAQVQADESSLRQTTIVAAFAGRVGLNLVNLGDYVKPGEDLLSLQAIDPIDVEFAMPEVYLNKTAVGNTITMRSDACPELTFTGKVYAIDSAVNPNNRTVMVRARVPNPQAKLLPGVFAEVNVLFAGDASVVMIPQTAIMYEVGETYVYRIVDGHAVKTKVNLGERDQQSVVVATGLSPNDVVVVAGQLKIGDGAPVVVMK